MRRAYAALALAVALIAGPGCAAQTASRPPAPAPAPAPAPTSSPRPSSPPVERPAAPADHGEARPGAQVGTTASGGRITVNAPRDSAASMPAVVDSTPSADAIAVLKTSPEPLGRPARGEAPRSGETPASAAPRDSAAAPAPGRSTGPGPARDSSAAIPALGDSTAVPTPEPTQPLGDRPGSRLTMPDTLVASPAPATGAAAPPAAAAPATPAAKAAPDTCWRVQFIAKPERARVQRLKAAAESQLELPMVIEKEKGLYKVRTRDCMNGEAAEALKRRAVAAGFAGAFKVRKP
ncbi:MAG: hypothetical protein HY076_03465 [Candidatus Eisenbacteria bacterium]|uniref:SPOR domain-containing protein n=1 Tax=Eiseniibacteriota bacterium TaxID=2212470 RepID=A0A9D6L9W6_UNCEI|nr:hypothetical protein [Candidatus Eisenbacteria bacterium]